MWYDAFTFWETNPGLTAPVAADYFARPFSEQEFAHFSAIGSLYPQGKTAAGKGPSDSQLVLRGKFCAAPVMMNTQILNDRTTSL
jgi:hypothetical protein